jgi:hypothetical protein
MRMRYFFIIPFFLSLLAFVVLNVAAYIVVNDNGLPGFESYAEGGFPFYWYSRNWVVGHAVDRGALFAALQLR